MKVVTGVLGLLLVTTVPSGANEQATGPTVVQSICHLHGDPSSDFMWSLCPQGIVFEHQYAYFGIWHEPVRIPAHRSPCEWQEPRWACASTVVMCTYEKCQ